jgi:hypothetical protein
MIETIAMPYGRSVRYIGVARRKGTRPLAGRRGRRAAKAAARALTRGVSGDTLLASRAVNLWHLDTHRMAAAVAHFAPAETATYRVSCHYKIRARSSKFGCRRPL